MMVPGGFDRDCVNTKPVYIRTEFRLEIVMGIETRIKPISYLKAHSADVIRDLEAGAPPLVITQNGEAKAVIQGVASYAATQELRSEEHTSELQSLMRISYAVFCLKKKK